MRIAWFTPFNPNSAIGHYSEAVVRELAKTDDVVVYVSDAPRTTDLGPARLVVLPDGSYPCQSELKTFDMTVYNMGNHVGYHKKIYDILVRHPGVVVLHDLVLRDFFFGYYLKDKQAPLTLAKHMICGEGPEAEAMAQAFLAERPCEAEALDDPIRLRFPMFQPALHRCHGVVVHSEYSRNRVAAAVAAPVARLDFPLFGPAVARAGAAPPPRPSSQGRVRLLTFGDLVPNKQIHAVIAAIAGSPFLRRCADYTVVGGGEADYLDRLRSAIDHHGLSDSVRLIGGWLPDDRLWELLTHADVVVNLRNPHFGESSASLLDALLAGVPSVVWNHGYYAEFPDDIVCKVSSEADLKTILERLCGDRDLRERIGRQARRHALTRFDTGVYVQRLRAFFNVVRSALPVLTLTDLISDRLLEFGRRPPDGLPERIAAEIALMTGDAAAA